MSRDGGRERRAHRGDRGVLRLVTESVAVGVSLERRGHVDLPPRRALEIGRGADANVVWQRMGPIRRRAANHAANRRVEPRAYDVAALDRDALRKMIEHTGCGVTGGALCDHREPAERLAPEDLEGDATRRFGCHMAPGVITPSWGTTYWS